MYLYAASCGKRSINLLNRLCISVSHQSLLRGIGTLASDAKARIKAAITLPFLIVYDNINIGYKVVEQRVTNRNTFHSGTAITLLPVWGNHPPESNAHQRVYLDPRPNEDKPCLQIQDIMLKPEEVTHTTEYFKYLLLVILCDHGGDYFKDFKSQLTPPSPIHQIPLHKTERYPLESVHIEEVSRQGNIDILNDVYIRQLGLSPETIPTTSKFIHGDLMTIDRLNLVSTSRALETTPFPKLDWPYPIFGLFHLKMAVVEMMLKAHLGKINQMDPAVLYRHNSDAHRKNISSNKNLRYRQGLELILLSLYARVLVLWSQVAGFSSLDDFAKSKPTMEQLTEIRDKIWTKWLSPHVTTSFLVFPFYSWLHPFSIAFSLFPFPYSPPLTHCITNSVVLLISVGCAAYSAQPPTCI